MFGEDQFIDCGKNNANVRIFACVHPPTSPPCKLATTSQGFIALMLTKCFKDVDDLSGV